MTEAGIASGIPSGMKLFEQKSVTTQPAGALIKAQFMRNRSRMPKKSPLALLHHSLEISDVRLCLAGIQLCLGDLDGFVIFALDA